MAILNSIVHMYNTISGGTILGKIGITTGALIVSYIAPISGLLLSCFAFTVTDLVYGIKVAKRQGQKITSEKGWKGTLKKILDEFTIILLARLLELSVIGEHGVFVLTGGTTVIITLTELWSILENLNTLKPNGTLRCLSKFLRKKGEEYTGIDFDKLQTIKNEDKDNDNKLDTSA